MMNHTSHVCQFCYSCHKSKIKLPTSLKDRELLFYIASIKSDMLNLR
ncbi:MAG: hypothetical protein HLUCCO02_08555 [Idiomarinaceae bacterium HL-53]|nr:MAG: hypothetical protein HLUCCO02_08555 [Idiomarinaceae bacterium HL-53]